MLSNGEETSVGAARPRDEAHESLPVAAEVRFKELLVHVNDGLAAVARDIQQLNRQHELQMSVLKSQLRQYRELHGGSSGQSVESEREDGVHFYAAHSAWSYEAHRVGSIKQQGSDVNTTRSSSKMEVAPAAGVTFMSQSEGQAVLPRLSFQERDQRPSIRERREQFLRSRTQSSVMGALQTTTTVTSDRRLLRLDDVDKDESEEDKVLSAVESAAHKKLPVTSPSTGRKRLAMRSGYAVSNRASARNSGLGNGTRTFRRMSSEATLLDALIVSRTSDKWPAMGPDSLLRRFLDVVGVICTILDIIVLPLMVAWDEAEESLGFNAVRTVVRVYWTLDVPFNFVTAFRSKEERLEIRMRVTARHYLSGWFMYDLLVTSCDWWSIFQSEYWILLLVFVSRLVRQVPRFSPKFASLTMALKRRLSLSSFELIVDVTLITSVIILFNHLITCVWYIIGHRSTAFNDTGATWLTQADMLDKTPEYEYFTGLHWAFTQMTPGSMEVVPVSTIERVYNVLVLIFGLIVGAGLTATLTSMMTQQRLAYEVRTKRKGQLEQFLSQEQVSRSLAMLIKKEITARYRERPRIKMTDVHDLTLVSQSSREELTYHIYGSCLSTYPLFQLVDTLDPHMLGSLCSKVIQIMDLVPGDILFEDCDEGSSLYFVAHGKMRYFPGPLCPEASWTLEDSRLGLERHSWCSEPALWTIWLHLGTLHAVYTTEVLCLSADAFQVELKNQPIFEDIAGEYCRAFHQYYKSACVQWSDLGTGTDHNDVLSGMSRRVRLTLAEPILASIQQRFQGLVRGNRAEKIVNLIREELMTGACYVCMQNDEVLRTVLVVSLRLRKEVDPEHYLVQIGEIKGTGVTAECNFPGTKRREQETSFDAIKRFVHSYFYTVSDGVQLEVDQTQSLIYIKDSPRYGIRTRYLRTTFNAILSDEKRLESLMMNQRPLGSLMQLEEIHAPSENPETGRFTWLRSLCPWGRRMRGSDSEPTASTSANLFKFDFGKPSTPEGQPERLGGRRSSFFFEAPDLEGVPVSKKAARENAEMVLLNKEEVVLLRDRNNILIFLWLNDTEHKVLASPHVEGILQLFVEDVANQVKVMPRVTTL